MEIYTNAPAPQRRVVVPFGAVPSSVDAFVYRDGVMVHEYTTVEVVTGGIAVTIPLFLNQFDGNIAVHFSITYAEDGETYTVNRSVPVNMVTPILSFAEIREIDANVFASDAEATKIEKAVRHIIQAYTGQEFGQFIGEKAVKSSGGPVLFLPAKLQAITAFNGQLFDSAHFLISEDGYTLRHYPWGVPPVKADYHGLHMHTGGVIHNPNSVRVGQFKDGHHYRINGSWGYDEVPAQVKEAAKLLVNDYACADAQYRDRYLQSMTAADWRIQFNGGAFVRTGNVRADQLLSDYVVTRGWGVI